MDIILCCSSKLAIIADKMLENSNMDGNATLINHIIFNYYNKKEKQQFFQLYHSYYTENSTHDKFEEYKLTQHKLQKKTVAGPFTPHHISASSSSSSS